MARLNPKAPKKLKLVRFQLLTKLIKPKYVCFNAFDVTQLNQTNPQSKNKHNNNCLFTGVSSDGEIHSFIYEHRRRRVSSRFHLKLFCFENRGIEESYLSLAITKNAKFIVTASKDIKINSPKFGRYSIVKVNVMRRKMYLSKIIQLDQDFLSNVLSGEFTLTAVGWADVVDFGVSLESLSQYFYVIDCQRKKIKEVEWLYFDELENDMGGESHEGRYRIKLGGVSCLSVVYLFKNFFILIDEKLLTNVAKLKVLKLVS